MKTKLSQEALSVLESMICDGNIAKLTTPDLERNLYEEVNETLVRLMGKWDRNKGGHVFTYEPEIAIHAVVHLGYMPDKNPTAFFQTPKKLIDDMFAILEDLPYTTYRAENHGIKVLEPSAGQGAIAKVIRSRFPNATLDTVEFLDINQEILEKEGFEPFCGSFLDFNTNYEIKYDLIMMNPPFSVEGDKLAFATHIEHAYKMLADDGELVAIAPTGWLNNSDKRSMAFKNWVETGAEFEIVDKGAFKESGTMIETCIIRKTKLPWKMKPKEGYNTHYEFEFNMIVHCSYDLDSFIEKNGHSDSSLNRFIDDVLNENKRFGNNFPAFFRDSYLNILRGMCDEIFEEQRYQNAPIAADEEFKMPSIIIEKPIQKTSTKEDISLGGLFAA